MKHDFHIGDRVKVTRNSGYLHIKPGMTGVVCYITEDYPGVVFVRWDLSSPRKPFHSCEDNDDIDHCERGYGWNVSYEIVSLIESCDLMQDFDVSMDELLNLL